MSLTWTGDMFLQTTVSEIAGAPERAGSISEAEFNRFYEVNSGDLWRYIARMTGDSTLADDVFQKAFFRFLRSNPPAGDTGHLRALLYRIATNLVIDHWRHQKREREWFSMAPAPNAAPREADFGRDVRRLLSGMKPQERALLWMAHAEEMSHAEIGEALGVGEKSVKVLLFRARKKFADVLRNHGITAEVLS